MSNMEVVPQSRIDLFAEMESHYEKEDTEYFVKLLDHDDYVVRCRATCILVDLGGEDKVKYIAKVLKDDPNELVRHEAAFSLGQMCFSSGIGPLEDATANDPSMFVRHEAAVALGVVGSTGEPEVLEKALNDPEESVRHSAVVALSNLEFMKTLCKSEKFGKLTGG
jgi:HEAT repeat protein|tara:strand:- start:860 stop:1357 length:498 start_codon:yes stop_codon:yes gene_type:complete